MNLKFNFTSLLIICFVFVLSCGTPATKITGSWKDPEAGSYKDFFIVVLSKNQQVRQQLEGDIADRLKKAHVKVTRSLEVFPHNEKVDTPEEKKAAIEKIKSLGHDA